MPIQDLTPQLRTRLNRLEKLVGVFVTLATLLMLAGLAYYVYHTAQRKGWFDTKAPYFVYLHSGAGLKIGDTIKLMGFDVGEITRITAEDPGKDFDVYVEFIVRAPFYGYVWNDSIVNVKSAGLLGSRFLEVTKGGTYAGTNLFPGTLVAKLHPTYKEDPATHRLTDFLPNGTNAVYAQYKKGKACWLQVDEPPDLSSQMDDVVRTAKGAVPAILDLTNQLSRIFSNASSVTVHLDELLVGFKPIVASMGTASTNLGVITTTLRDTKGALGEWLLPTNIQEQLVLLLPNLNGVVTNVNTNLVSVISNLNANLENVANITSNLNVQVQANTNILSSLSAAVVHADEMIQGLKRHWLLRSAFKTDGSSTNPPPRPPAQSPKGAFRK